MDKNTTQVESTKLPYHRPVLACYGDVKVLTLGNQNNNHLDGAPFAQGT